MVPCEREPRKAAGPQLNAMPVFVNEAGFLHARACRRTCNTLCSSVLLRHMQKQTISLRLDSKKVEALDALAELLDRDRSYLVNQAVDAYLDVQQWQIDQIKEGLRLADEGSLVDHTAVKKLARQWRKP